MHYTHDMERKVAGLCMFHGSFTRAGVYDGNRGSLCWEAGQGATDDSHVSTLLLFSQGLITLWTVNRACKWV